MVYDGVDLTSEQLGTPYTSKLLELVWFRLGMNLHKEVVMGCYLARGVLEQKQKDGGKSSLLDILYFVV